MGGIHQARGAEDAATLRGVNARPHFCLGGILRPSAVFLKPPDNQRACPVAPDWS